MRNIVRFVPRRGIEVLSVPNDSVLIEVLPESLSNVPFVGIPVIPPGIVFRNQRMGRMVTVRTVDRKRMKNSWIRIT